MQVLNQFNQPNHSQKGFTLIEILVVMVILGILVAVAATSFVAAQQKGRDSRRKHDLEQISKSLELYYNDKGEYPGSSADGLIMGCDGGAACDWGEAFEDDNGTLYMVELPQDPLNNDYFYVASLDGKDYQLYAYLENSKDQAVSKDANGNVEFYSGTECGAFMCNYGVASSSIRPEDGHPLTIE